MGAELHRRGGLPGLAHRGPVVPVHLDGTRHILPKGAHGFRRTRTTITFGTPLRPDEDETARRFATRIETAVATMANEAGTDWWTARKQARPGCHSPTAGPGRGGLAPVVDADPGTGPEASPTMGSDWPRTGALTAH